MLITILGAHTIYILIIILNIIVITTITIVTPHHHHHHHHHSSSSIIIIITPHHSSSSSSSLLIIHHHHHHHHSSSSIIHHHHRHRHCDVNWKKEINNLGPHQTWQNQFQDFDERMVNSLHEFLEKTVKDSGHTQLADIIIIQLLEKVYSVRLSTAVPHVLICIIGKRTTKYDG
jgi:hypothetical protein